MKNKLWLVAVDKEQKIQSTIIRVIANFYLHFKII